MTLPEAPLPDAKPVAALYEPRPSDVYAPPLSTALKLARKDLAAHQGANIHDHTAMVAAAVVLETRLRLLLAALDADAAEVALPVPVPVGPEPQPSEVESLKARVAELEELRELATVLEIPRPGKLPLQLRLAYGHDDRWAICDREGRRWHREHGWVFEAQGIRDEEQRDTSRFTLAEAVPLARRLAESEASADKLTKTFSPVASLREPDGEHYPHVHHAYRVSHDLPETGGA